MRVGTTYDPRFIKDAVALVEKSNRSVGDIAKDLGIPRATLYLWYRKANMPEKSRGRKKAEKPEVAAETDKEKAVRLERELKAARKEIEDLRLDREILKKAAAFFARESE